jgi:hypothetical protein
MKLTCQYPCWANEPIAEGTAGEGVTGQGSIDQAALCDAPGEFDQLDEQKQTEKPDCDRRHYGYCNNPSHQTTTTIKNDFLIPRNPLVSVSQRLVFMSPQIQFILL